MKPDPSPAAVPQTFLDYVKSLGPGIVVVLTWLGAGDIVEVGVAGGNFGYALMWVVVVAVFMRFLFVSLIAKYQLCNQHREGVVDGLARLHPAYPLVLLIAAVVMGHIYGAYMTVGVGEASRNLTGIGQTWQWALLWNGIAVAIVFKPAFARIELLFKLLLALLSVSLLGTAIWVGPNAAGIVEGTFAFKLPPRTYTHSHVHTHPGPPAETHAHPHTHTAGPFAPLLVAVGMIGAVGGSLMNLVYPYFLEGKGWRGPRYRRVQFYDFLLAILVMIILDLAIWTLGAELLYPRGMTIESMDDLPQLLSEVLGNAGRILFYLGIIAAVYSSLVGHALGLGCLGSHGYLRWRSGAGLPIEDYRTHPCYRMIAIWCLVTPLIWCTPIPGLPDFVFLTLVANSIQVVLIPILAGGLWWITASPRFIGDAYRNRWWENLVMLVLFGLALWGAYGAIVSVSEAVFGSR